MTTPADRVAAHNAGRHGPYPWNRDRLCSLCVCARCGAPLAQVLRASIPKAVCSHVLRLGHHRDQAE